MENCAICNSENIVQIKTYKFNWYFCNSCGCGSSELRQKYPLNSINWLFVKYLKYKNWKRTINRLTKDKSVEDNNSTIYDYFVTQDHIDWSIQNAKEFEKTIIKNYQIELKDKHVLDISGGNGHCLKYFIDKYKCDGVLTEFNKRAIKYASEQLNLKTQYYDFSVHEPTSIFKEKKFDIIFMRACIMFVSELDKTIIGLKKILKDGGLLIIQNSIIPTLGVILRTQFDEYNFLSLYSSQFLTKTLEKNDFTLLQIRRNPDFSLYVSDFHKYPIEKKLLLYYEHLATKENSLNSFNFIARDRRRYDFVFKNEKKSI